MSGLSSVSDVAIITAIFDHYDNIKPIRKQVGLDVDWVLVTDSEDMALQAMQVGWRAVIKPMPKYKHPNRAAKAPKLAPWNYTDAPESIWVDASFRVISETFAAEAMSYANPIAQFKHPWRDCLWDEAHASKDLPKYVREPIAQQALQYRESGYPLHWGLWAAGVIARKHTDEMRVLGERWQEEIFNWSFQDQVSQPYVLMELGIKPTDFPGTHFMNDWLVYEGSGRH
jgi:hypothetical protein